MNRNVKKVLILLITCILLTGCGESKKDLENEKNPEKFIQDNFKNYYHKDIIINNIQEKEDNKGNKTKLIDVSLKEEESFTFNACSYWDVNKILKTRHYTSVNNYENKYSTKLLKTYLTEEFGNLSFEKKSTEYNEYCHLERDIATLELNTLENINKLAKTLSEITTKKETYALHLNIKYQDKKVNLTINNEQKEETYLAELSKLTEPEAN